MVIEHGNITFARFLETSLNRFKISERRVCQGKLCSSNVQTEKYNAVKVRFISYNGEYFFVIDFCGSIEIFVFLALAWKWKNIVICVIYIRHSISE